MRGGKGGKDRGWQSVLETHAILDPLSSILKKSPFPPLALPPYSREHPVEVDIAVEQVNAFGQRMPGRGDAEDGASGLHGP